MLNEFLTLEMRDLEIEGFEHVIEVTDPDAGLHAIIAIHDTRLGPALGGIRVFPYSSFDDALEDALRLAKGMTYKSAVAKMGTGGGKSVIIADHRKPKPEKMLLAFAEAINSLKGLYIGAEDAGMPLADLAVLRKGTRFLVGLPHPKSSGDPSPFTAWGGFQGIRAVCQHLWGNSSPYGKTIAIQGLGAVGMKLAERLFWEGADLIVSDLDESRVAAAVKTFGARPLPPEEIIGCPCDIFSPCAMGGVLNSAVIEHLRCRAVAGLANNQLLTEADGDKLAAKNILYVPDFVINSGGLLNVCAELHPEGYHPRVGRDRTCGIYEQLLSIFEMAGKKQQPTHRIVNEFAEYNLAHGVGRRTQPFVFHH